DRRDRLPGGGPSGPPPFSLSRPRHRKTIAVGQALRHPDIVRTTAGAAMIASLALAAALGFQTAPAAQDGPIVTAAPASGETSEALRIREAVAYANPLPRGAPSEDYPLVAWCEALVNG